MTIKELIEVLEKYDDKDKQIDFITPKVEVYDKVLFLEYEEYLVMKLDKLGV